MLADDHHVGRDGLRVLLERELDYAVVGEASDGQERCLGYLQHTLIESAATLA